jgi:hypothetical protein
MMLAPGRAIHEGRSLWEFKLASQFTANRAQLRSVSFRITSFAFRSFNTLNYPVASSVVAGYTSGRGIP